MILTDLGSYVAQNGVSVLPWDILLEAGVEGVVFKGAQEDMSRGVSTIRSIQQAYGGGAKTVGCYYWDDPTVDVRILLEAYKRAGDIEKPEFGSVDIEQYKDWQGNALDPNLISDHAQSLTEGLAAYFKEILWMPYSAKYMLGHAPGLAKWIDNFENWTAAWTDSPMQRYRLPILEIARGDVRRTWYDAKGNPIRNADGSYQYSTYKIQDNWQATTSARVCLLRQYSSRILLPYDRVAGTIYDHQYDWNYTPLTIDEWKKKIKHEYPGEITMANTYKQTVLEKDRAPFLVLSGDDKQVDMPAVAGDVNAVMLKMGGQNGKEHAEVYADSAFPIRAKLAGNTPVVGWFDLDAKYPLWTRQFNLTVEDPTHDSFSKREWFKNETLKMILDTWRSIPIPPAEWAAHDLKISAVDGGWLPVSGLVLYMGNVKYPGGDIPGVWQLAVLDDVLKYLDIFKQGKYIPNIPIFLVCSPKFYKKYDADEAWRAGLPNRIANGQMAGCGVLETGIDTDMNDKPVVGLFTEVPMATPFATVKEIFAYRPADSYKYSFLPYGITNIQFHVYSWNRFRANPVKTNNTPSPIMVGVWCDTPAEMLKTLKVPATVPPVEPPPPDNWQARALAAEASLLAAESKLAAIKAIVG